MEKLKLTEDIKVGKRKFKKGSTITLTQNDKAIEADYGGGMIIGFIPNDCTARELFDQIIAKAEKMAGKAEEVPPGGWRGKEEGRKKVQEMQEALTPASEPAELPVTVSFDPGTKFDVKEPNLNNSQNDNPSQNSDNAEASDSAGQAES